MNKKKAQIHMMETIAVLFIFFILILVGLAFYFNIIRGGIEIQKEESAQLDSVEVAQRASTLPELQCSEDNIVSDNCIDLYKLEAASEIMLANQLYYYDKLLFSTIIVKEIYPDQNEWVLYDRPLENAERRLTFVPISLLDPVNNKNSFGIMNVTLFLR